MYDSEIDEVIVSGAAAYQNAYDFMKLVLPRHTDKIRLYNDVMPIFARYNVEEQISALYQSSVYLESGGSLVINQTEALIAIDINSGRYTDEHNVENTALKTNLEAVPEIVRQIKLRDLSGLIVIDFIDMELVHNRKKVEKAFKDAFVNDRARVQFSRISEFGLLEMSRQRLRQNFIESNFLSCSACDGRGRVRSMTLTAVAILRAIEKEIAFDKECEEIRVGVSSACAIYLFNNKAQDVQELQRISNKRIEFFIDEAAGMDGFFIEKSRFTSQKKIPTPLSAIGTEPYREEKTSDNVNLEEVDSNTANKKPHAHQHKYKKRYKKHINQNPNQKQRFDPPAQQPQKGEDKKGLLKTIWKKFTD